MVGTCILPAMQYSKEKEMVHGTERNKGTCKVERNCEKHLKIICY